MKTYQLETLAFLAACPPTVPSDPAAPLLTPAPITTTVRPMRKRLNPEQSRSEILAAAGRVAMRDGFHEVTIAGTAAEASRAPGLVWHYFRSRDLLRSALMTEAIAQRCAPIVAQGLSLGDPQAVNAPGSLLREARAILAAR